jgi:hypothetical protein
MDHHKAENMREAVVADLAEGAWPARNADLMERTELDGGFRLVVSPSAA